MLLVMAVFGCINAIGSHDISNFGHRPIRSDIIGGSWVGVRCVKWALSAELSRK